MGQLKDLTGKKFGRWTAIKQDGRSNAGGVLWLCRCDCGNKSTVSAWHLRSGKSKSCGCLQRECVAKINKLPEGVAAFNFLFGNYKRGAKRRGFKFELNEDEFRLLTKQPCHYCGSAPSNTSWGGGRVGHSNGPYIYSGIDRIENAAGYVEGNCVPCCKTCNFAKRTMEYGEFIDWISRVYNNVKEV
jgi:hypothetical protein